VWFLYPQPVYPYPDPYLPPGIIPAGPPGSFYYYCPAPPGYFPYQYYCPTGWQAVPAR
jgi:hypothetical protein